MAITASITLKADPVTGVGKTGDWLDVTGSNFGSAPNIVLFDPVRLVSNQSFRLDSPLRGNYAYVTSNAKAVYDNGEYWLSSRDPTQESSTNANTVNLGFETTPFNQFYWFHRLKGRTGKKFPWATVADGSPVWTSVIMKPWWFTDINNNNSVDQVLPNFNASGMTMFGNSNQLARSSGGAAPWPNSQSLDPTKPLCLGYYQSGDESSFNAKDATILTQRYDQSGFSENVFTGDPFRCNNPPTLYPLVQNSATYIVAINGVDIPNPFVSSASATLAEILNGLITYINSNQSLVYALINTGNTGVGIHTIDTANSINITASTNIARPILTPTVQNNATYSVYVNSVLVPNPFVSSASATLAEILNGVTNYINTNSTTISAVIDSGNTAINVFTPNRTLDCVVTTSANFSGNGLPTGTGAPILGASQYFRLQWMSQTNTPTGGWANVQMLTNWMYLATGVNARAAIFIGDAPTLAACKDIRPLNYRLWTDNRIVVDKLGLSGYVHHRHADGTVQNNILGEII